MEKYSVYNFHRTRDQVFFDFQLEGGNIISIDATVNGLHIWLIWL